MYEIDESIDLYLVAQKFIQQEQDKIQNCGNEQAQTIKEDKKIEYSKDTIKNFLAPLKFIGGYDKMEVYKNLSNHFSLTSRKINKYIDKQNNLYSNLQSELSELQNQNLRSSITVLTRFNSKIWRLYLFTVMKYAKYKFKYLHTLIPKVEKNIYILKKLKHLADKLHIKPLLAFFLIDNIQKLSESDVSYRLYFKIESIKRTLDDLKSAIEFFPINFTKENSKDYLNSLISSSQKFIDPLTGYLKESDEYLNFVDFINSPYSPLVGIIQLGELEVEEQIRSSCKILRSYAQITDKTQISILGFFCMRYWIDKNFARTQAKKNTSHQINNEKENKEDISFVFSKYRNFKLLDLNPPSKLGKFFDKNINILDFFQLPGTQILNPSPNLLFSTIFMTNPCDIAYSISQINLRISAYVAGLACTSLEDEIVQIGSEFLWKIIFIFCCIPGIEHAFDLMHYWENYQYSPKELFKSIQIPTKALNSLIKKMSKR
ncbi:hypothetical protein M9Y10_008651 [Tritrichomonas musculus]|uniref:Uncharacterized protein n=1 Tax=Tritrichomonas musculus TaxID=1915356 RepID=A0ABR2IZT9_9EUKA